VSKLGKAREWLEGLLGGGPVPAAQVAARALEAGHAPATLRKAAVALAVVKVREGDLGSPDQRWVWSLPTGEQVEETDERVSVTSGDHVGPEPLKVLSALRLEDGSTWGLKATPLQWRDAEQVLARDPEVRRFWLGRPRGFSKTSDCAAFTISAALSGLIPPGERGFCVAGDRDQAALVSQAVAGFVRRTDELHGVVQVDRNEIKFGTVSVTVEVLSSDAPSAWGRRGHWWIVDELPSWSDTPNSHEFFDAVVSAWAKVPTCRAIIIGTAGSPVHFARRHYETAAASNSWRLSDTHDTAPWMLASDIADQQRSLSAGTFARLFRNEWVQAEDHLVSEENLRRCVTVTDWPADPKPNTRYVIGVDLATKFDSTAVCVAHTETRGGERHVVVDDLEVHAPRPGADVSLANVERRVEQLSRRYRGAQVFFDPSNAAQMLENLRGRGVRCEEFKFTAASNDKMTNTLHTMLRDACIDLPDDERLLDELLSVRVVETRLGGLKVDTIPGKHDDQVDVLGIVTLTLMGRRASTGGTGTSFSGPPIYRPSAVPVAALWAPPSWADVR
jgi:Terminase large subunit, ATPase domain